MKVNQARVAISGDQLARARAALHVLQTPPMGGFSIVPSDHAFVAFVAAAPDSDFA